MRRAAMPKPSTAGNWFSELTGPRRLSVGQLLAMNKEYAMAGASSGIWPGAHRAWRHATPQGDVT